MKKIVIILAIFLSACTSRIGGISIATMEGTNLKGDLNLYEYPSQEVAVEEYTEIYFVFPKKIPRLKNVVKKALKEGNGNVLINARVQQTYMWYVFWGWWRMDLIGTVVNVPDDKLEKI